MDLVTKVIITAMEEEADLVIKRFNLKEVKAFHTFKIYEWSRQNEWSGEKIVLALAWIGKIQAAIATTYLFENYMVDKLVNIWIAGNVWWDEYKIGDVFLPNTFIQHDMYLPFDWEHLDYAKKAIFIENAVDKNYDLTKFGLIMNWVCITWDQFVDDANKVLELKEKHSADVCEMEAFAILSVAREYNSLDKCLVIKAISDWANNEAIDAHMNNLEFAMENSINVLELVL